MAVNPRKRAGISIYCLDFVYMIVHVAHIWGTSKNIEMRPELCEGSVRLVLILKNPTSIR